MIFCGFFFGYFLGRPYSMVYWGYFFKVGWFPGLYFLGGVIPRVFFFRWGGFIGWLFRSPFRDFFLPGLFYLGCFFRGLFFCETFLVHVGGLYYNHIFLEWLFWCFYVLAFSVLCLAYFF